jgi:hypothetical protein
MKAVRFVGVRSPAQIRDVPKPEAGPGQVVIESAEPAYATPTFTLWSKTSGSVANSLSGMKTLVG